MARKSFLQLRKGILREKFYVNSILGTTNKHLVPCRPLHSLCAKQPCHRAVALRSLPTFIRTQFLYTTSTLVDEEIQVKYSNGLPQLFIPLPSRRETCQFTLRPISNNVGDLLDYIQNEDHGVDRVSVYNTEGIRISKSTPVDILLQKPCELVINDLRYLINPPKPVAELSEHMNELGDVKTAISQMYSTLNITQYQLEKEKELKTELESLRTQIAPLELEIKEIEDMAKKKLARMPWLGLGFMSVQFGVLARLTWWEYSWDIMEPVTYFVTYGTLIVWHTYYTYTRQEANYKDMENHQYLLYVHDLISKKNVNLTEYNRLKEAIYQAETDLKRLRDPLQMQLPISQLQPDKFSENDSSRSITDATSNQPVLS